MNILVSRLIIKDRQYSNALFIHIPKTAGSSISEATNYFFPDNWKREYPRRHDPYFYLKSNNLIDDSVFLFTVVRNPFTRTYSCFKQFNRTNNQDITFSNYLNNVKMDIGFNETPMLKLPQYFYLLNSKDDKVITNNETSNIKIYKFENLKEFENDFNFMLNFINQSQYSANEYNNDYTKENIELVQNLYNLDFTFFGYSKQFKKMIGEV